MEQAATPETPTLLEATSYYDVWGENEAVAAKERPSLGETLSSTTASKLYPQRIHNQSKILFPKTTMEG
jgi:hypothetical protein